MDRTLLWVVLALLLVPTSVGQDGAGDEDAGNASDPPRGPPEGRGKANNASANASDNESGNASVDAQGERGPPEGRGRPTWTPPELAAETAAAFPLEVQGRYISFTLDATGVSALTIHQEPLSDISVELGELVTAERVGNQILIETTTATLRAVDVPATQLHLAGAGLTTELPPTTELTSGARVLLTVDEEGLHLHVKSPDGVLGAAPATTLAPANVHAMARGRTGLVADDDGETLGVEASNGNLHGRFAAETEAAGEETIQFNVGLLRAMLIEDTDGDGELDVGEPSLAEADLTVGATSVVDGDDLVTTWDLWSGTLTAVGELDARTLKITYIVEGLAPAPGTLFVLESVADAPGNAELTATAMGAVARSGSLEARYGVDGPVTVDGEEAWAGSTVQVAEDGTVHVFIAYPAGDEIVHDPQVAIASLPGITVLSAARPAAVLIGAALAALFVLGTAWVRRH